MTLTKQERRARRKKNSECAFKDCCSSSPDSSDVRKHSRLQTCSETHDVVVTREVCCYENGDRYPCA